MKSFSIESRKWLSRLPLGTNFKESWPVLAQESSYGRRRLARLLQVSVRTLDRYFQRHLAVSVSRWLREAQFLMASPVTSDTVEGAQKAMQALNGSMNNGRFINVQEARHSREEGYFQDHIPRREFRKLY